jgi:RNA polymerase sigma-70 factor, ECF subfamily
MKRRLTLSEYAIPVLGIKARGRQTEKIKIEGARTNAPASMADDRTSIINSDAANAPQIRLPGSIDTPSSNGFASSNGAVALNGSVSVNNATAAFEKKSKAELIKLEDAELLRRFQSGDETSFYVLFERRHKEIYTHCFRMCSRDAEKANDACQDTFVKVFTRKDLFTDATNGRAWLYRIASNTCLNQLRYDRRHPTDQLEENVNSFDPQMQPDFSTEQESLRSSLEAAVAKLPIELREPFLLREMEEFSYEDASEQLGITVAACRQRVYRAKQILREELEHVVTGEPEKKKKWTLSRSKK